MDVHSAGSPRVTPLGAGSPLGQALSSALARPGRATLVLLTGRSGQDLDAALAHLVLPTVSEHLGDRGRLTQVTGLGWEHQRAERVLDRLGLPRKLADLVDALDVRDPLAIVVREAQDVDVKSLRLLSSAVHRLDRVPLLIVVAGTIPEFDPTGSVLVELHRAHRPTSYAVESLDIAGVHEIAASVGIALDAFAARRLWRHTEGSPSQIVEILTHVDPRHWRQIDAQMPAAPSALRAASAELARCDADVRALVETCAVIGRWASLAEVDAIARVQDLMGALDRAEASHLLVVRPGFRPTIGFPSRMARAAALEATGVLRRQELYARAAAVLTNPRESLQHRVRAGLEPDENLVEALVAHARACALRGAWRDASHAWLSAHRLASDPAVAEDCLVRSLDALVSAGDLVEATALTPELEGVRTSAARLGVQGYQQLLLGHRHEASDLLQRAWDSREPGDEAGSAMLAHRLALSALVDWDCEQVVRWTDEAIARTDAGGPAGFEARTMRGLGLGGLGRTAEALAEYESVTTEAGGGPQGQRALMGQGWLHLALDRVPLASHELALAAPQEVWGGSSRVSLWAYGWLARTRIALGDLTAAKAAVDAALPLLAQTGQKIALPLIHWSGAEIAALRGDWPTAEQHAAEAESVRTDYGGMAVAAALARASVALAQGDYAAVIRALQPVSCAKRNPGLDEPGFWPWHDVYATALVATGEITRADTFLAPHEELAAARQHRSAMARLGSIRARIEMSSGDVLAGRARFEAALALLGGEASPYLRTRIRYAYGQSLRRAGKRRDAEEQLLLARQGYAAMGATTYVTRCDSELKAGTRAKGPVGLTDLTPQERTVVELVCQGLSNAEVAASLFVSGKTVQYHLTRVYRRLGVRSRAELTALLASGERRQG